MRTPVGSSKIVARSSQSSPGCEPSGVIFTFCAHAAALPTASANSAAPAYVQMFRFAAPPCTLVVRWTVGRQVYRLRAIACQERAYQRPGNTGFPYHAAPFVVFRLDIRPERLGRGRPHFQSLPEQRFARVGHVEDLHQFLVQPGDDVLRRLRRHDETAFSSSGIRIPPNEVRCHYALLSLCGIGKTGSFRKDERRDAAHPRFPCNIQRFSAFSRRGPGPAHRLLFSSREMNTKAPSEPGRFAMVTMLPPLLTRNAASLMSRSRSFNPQGKCLFPGAAHLLAQARVSGAPVVDQDGRCIGVISTTDFLHFAEKGKTPIHSKQDSVHSWTQIWRPKANQRDVSKIS